MTQSGRQMEFLAAGPGSCRRVSDTFDDDDLQLARAVLLAVRRGLKVLGRFVAGDRFFEARELVHDEAVEFLRALKDLELAAARQELAAEFPDDRRCQISVLLVLLGVVDLRARDPKSDHFAPHATRSITRPTTADGQGGAKGNLQRNPQKNLS